MHIIFRRRNYLTSWGFQGRFVLPFLLASLVANIIAVTLFIVLAEGTLERHLYSMRMPHLSAGALLLPAVFRASVVSIVAVALSILWASRNMNRKIAESLHQVRMDLQRIVAGDLSSRVTPRESDEFQDFSGQLNVMIDELNRRFSVLRKQVHGLAQKADAVRMAATPEEMAVEKEGMIRILRSLEEQIGEFKL
jgi:methyl-accepting chemotaxis protein